MALVRNSGEMAELVADYLVSHPDFLNEYPEVLAALRLTHQSGKNISSLIELQVERLRETGRYQQQRIEYLHQATEQEQALALDVQAAALGMINADSPETLVELLIQICKNRFHAGTLNIFFFTDTDFSFRLKHVFFEHRDSSLQRMFTELFNRNKALCDSLQQEYVHLLFGKHIHVNSTLLLPHTGAEYSMLLAFASHRENAYRQGFEVKMLGFLKEIFVSRVDGWLPGGTC